MTYDDLIFGFQSKALSGGYFEQFIYGYDDRINTAMTKDQNEEPNSYPIMLIPPQKSSSDRLKVERLQPFSISGHKRAKIQRNVTLTILSDVVTFTTGVFVTGESIVIKDERTNFEIPLKITSVVATLATCTSQITLIDGSIVSTVEEDHAVIHGDLQEAMMDVIAAVGAGFTNTSGDSVRPQSIAVPSLNVFRMDEYASRGYVRLVMEFPVDLKNCAL